VSQCVVSGRGVQPTGIRVNDLAMFHVSTFNAGQGDLEVKVSRSRGAADVPVRVVKVGICCLSDTVFINVQFHLCLSVL